MDPNQADQLGKAFTDQYYALFDQKATRQQVGNLYHREAYLTFETQKVFGAANIATKLGEMPFENICRVITTVDCHPLAGSVPGVLIQVLGQLKTDSENDKVMGFSQTFVLRNVENNFWLFNDVFRLVLHNIAA